MNEQTITNNNSISITRPVSKAFSNLFTFTPKNIIILVIFTFFTTLILFELYYSNDTNARYRERL